MRGIGIWLTDMKHLSVVVEVGVFGMIVIEVQVLLYHFLSPVNIHKKECIVEMACGPVFSYQAMEIMVNSKLGNVA